VQSLRRNRKRTRLIGAIAPLQANATAQFIDPPTCEKCGRILFEIVDLPSR